MKIVLWLLLYVVVLNPVGKGKIHRQDRIYTVLCLAVWLPLLMLCISLRVWIRCLSPHPEGLPSVSHAGRVCWQRVLSICVLISPSLLRSSFAGYGILGLTVFFFQHCLLASGFWWEASRTVSWVFWLVWGALFASCFWRHLWRVWLWAPEGASYLELVQLLAYGDCFPSDSEGLWPLFPQGFFLPLSLSPQTPIVCTRVVNGVLWSLRPCSFFFILFPISQTGTSDLYSRSQVLSFANGNLALNHCGEAFISVNCTF